MGLRVGNPERMCVAFPDHLKLTTECCEQPREGVTREPTPNLSTTGPVKFSTGLVQALSTPTIYTTYGLDDAIQNYFEAFGGPGGSLVTVYS